MSGYTVAGKYATYSSGYCIKECLHRDRSLFGLQMGHDMVKVMSDQFSIQDFQTVDQNVLITNLHVNSADELLKDNIQKKSLPPGGYWIERDKKEGNRGG